MARLAGLGVAVAAALACGPAAGGSANVEIKALVPVLCDVGIASFEVVTKNPLLIAVSVERDCNATHKLSVTYQPAALTAPQDFHVTFDGAGPSASAPGTVTFENLPFTNSIEPLYISYQGPAAERALIKDTVVIGITAQ